jgi:hypothetical protein
VAHHGQDAHATSFPASSAVPPFLPFVFFVVLSFLSRKCTSCRFSGRLSSFLLQPKRSSVLTQNKGQFHNARKRAEQPISAGNRVLRKDVSADECSCHSLSGLRR